MLRDGFLKVLTLLLAVLIVVAIIGSGVHLLNIAFNNTPEIIKIEPNNIEEVFTEKDFQKEFIKTLTITNLAKDMDIDFKIKSFHEGIIGEDNYINHIDEEINLINIIDNTNKTYDPIIRELNNSIIRLRSNIIKNNNNISIINTNKSKQMQDKKINDLNILISSLNFEIGKLNRLIKKLNNSIESLDINRNQIEESIKILEGQNQKASTATAELLNAIPENFPAGNFIFTKIEGDRRLEKGKNIVLLKFFVPYKILKGEYKAEFRINKGEKLLEAVPITLKIVDIKTTPVIDNKTNTTKK
jgi:hypothetical protein